MYDRRLDAIVASADLGSFSRAAARLHVSAPALVKQVSGFEAEHGVILFTRSHEGVALTQAGRSLVEDARYVMRLSEDALRRARSVAGAAGAVRLGVSLMCPGRNTLELWPRVHELEPELRIDIIPVDDLYDARSTVMTSLGQTVDVIQTSYSTSLWGDSCSRLPLFSVPLRLDVLRTSPLASRDSLAIDDLVGARVRILRHGNDEMDAFRDLLLGRGDVEVIDVGRFDFALFNEAEEHGDAVLTCGAWSGVHPAFAGVPIDCERGVTCYLAYPPDPTPQVGRFVDAMRRVLGQ